MDTLLEKAIKQLESLPKKRQDIYASMIFDELDSEMYWSKIFARTSDKQLKKMEQMVRDEIKKGATPISRFLRP